MSGSRLKGPCAIRPPCAPPSSNPPPATRMDAGPHLLILNRHAVSGERKRPGQRPPGVLFGVAVLNRRGAVSLGERAKEAGLEINLSSWEWWWSAPQNRPPTVWRNSVGGSGRAKQRDAVLTGRQLSRCSPALRWPERQPCSDWSYSPTSGVFTVSAIEPTSGSAASAAVSVSNAR